jgi:CheY-like chemotaxis protein
VKKDKRKLILIVECDDLLVKAEKEFLEKLGHETKIFKSGEACLRFLLTKKPDLILLELKLPQMTGFEVMEAIQKRKNWASIPLIILTASIQKEDKEKAFQLGAKKYIVKSDVDLGLIEQEINSLIS